MSAGAFFQRAFFLVRHHVDSSLPTELVKIFEILYKKIKTIWVMVQMVNGIVRL